MNDLINKYKLKELSQRNKRLITEWQGIDTLCEHRKALSQNPRKPSISYIIRRKNAIGLPTEYEIWYRCKSIVGVKGKVIPREPIFGFLHKMRIILPTSYPGLDGSPQFNFLTDVWHPNIRYAGDFKGRVCLTMNDMGAMTTLKVLVLRVEQYLKYQLYHAENTYPYPEDISVAEWVREEGDPNGWTHFGQDMSEVDTATKTGVTSGIKTSNDNNNITIRKTFSI